MTNRHDIAPEGNKTQEGQPWGWRIVRQRSAVPARRTPDLQGGSMTSNSVDQTVVTESQTAVPAQDAGVAPATRETVRTAHSTTTASPGGSEMTRRIVVLIFGLVQVLITLRVVLLLLDAREANGIVSGILNLSQLFVAPFEGILRTNALHSAGSVLDVAAIVALVGWTIIELIVLWVVGIFRRQPA
jgi:hypothetical protein